jgi:hypothetical protein
MGAIIRESVTVDPISSERIDTTGAIHRYNFGWVKIHRMVGGTPPAGTVVESSVTGISGMDNIFSEVTTQEIFPPSLETPDAYTVSDPEGVKVTSFFKNGIKKRTMIRTRPIGVSEILVLGQAEFSIVENKVYAGSFGPGAIMAPAGSGVQAAEGGVTITAANGIVTETKIKG